MWIRLLYFDLYFETQCLNIPFKLMIQQFRISKNTFTPLSREPAIVRKIVKPSAKRIN